MDDHVPQYLDSIENKSKESLKINLYNDGVTPLMSAIKTRNLKAGNELIKTDCDFNLKDKNGETALMYALRNYHKYDDPMTFYILPKLIASTDCNIQNNKNQTAANMFLSLPLKKGEYHPIFCPKGDYHRSSCQSIFTKQLFDNTDCNLVDNKGHSPLATAIIMEKSMLAIDLISRCNPNMISIYGYTPLMLAINTGNKEIAQKLIPISDLEIRNFYNETALVWAEKNNIEIANEIKKHLKTKTN